jgi:uncharacterized membrane protein YidH (DUF202 family)
MEKGPGDDASRQTWLAHERTLLAWWRTALAAIAVALGVGRLLPSLLHVGKTPFIVIGAGFGALATGLVLYAAWRHRQVQRILDRGGVPRLDDGFVLVVTAALTILLLATTVVISAAR